MRRLLSVLLGLLAAGPAPAQHARPPQPRPVPVPPIPVPPPPPRPRVPPPPEVVRAWDAAQSGERLLVQGRIDEAITHFRRTVETSPGNDRTIYFFNSIHLRALAFVLIRASRLDEADREIVWFLDRSRPDPPLRNDEAVLPLLDLRLYIHAGRANIDQVLALLDARAAFAGSRHAGCPSGVYFPEVVAPAHHDPRVAAKLRALGCWDSIIAQLDELAARPIGANMFDPGLPPRAAHVPPE